MIKNPPADAGDLGDSERPWVGKIPWRRAWRPTPVFLPGESHRQSSLEGYSPRGSQRNMAEVTQHTHTHTHTLITTLAHKGNVEESITSSERIPLE